MGNKFIKKVITVLVFILMILTLFVIRGRLDATAQRQYKQGMGYFKEKDYSNAFYNFKQVNSFSKFYKPALLKQFQCANILHDKKTASLILKKLTKVVKDENVRPYVLYSDAILSQELELDTKVKQLKKFKYLLETYPENDFGYASRYKFASLIESDNKNIAKEKFVEYLSYAPNGRFAQDALLKLKEYKTLSKEDYEIIAAAYFKNNDFRSAYDTYLKTDLNKNWVEISKCAKNVKDYDKELEFIKNGLVGFYKPDEKEISYAIERYISLTKQNRIQALNILYAGNEKAYIFPTIEYKLAESLSSLKAYELYKDIVLNYSSSYWASNAFWELFFYNYKQGHYQTCIKLYDTYFSQFENSQDAPRITYWYGKALLMDKKRQSARDAFYKVINNYPLDFYALLSARQLKLSGKEKIITKKRIASYNINSISKHIFKNSLLEFLVKYDDFETIEELKIDNEAIKSWVLNKKEQYPISITTIRKEVLEKEKISFSDWELKLMYPIVYEDIVNKYAKKYNRSPYLFLSLIREESHFNKYAKSSVGALGLAQLMPSTANFISKENIVKSSLFEPETSIDLGMKYYTYLVDYFNGNEFLAIMAYNAGPGNIEKWLKIHSDLEIDMFIENVPYLETKNYIKKILSSYWAYVHIYSNRYL